MGIFADLETKDVERSQDRVGGGGAFRTVPSDIYVMTIEAMYEVPSSSGARRIDLLAKMEDGSEYKESYYITNREGKPYYVTKTGKKAFLPGYEVVDDICRIVTDKPLAEQDTEEKVFNIYDFDAGREIPKSVQTLVDLSGAKIALAVALELHNKVQRVDGKYVDTPETVERNSTHRAMHPEFKLTVGEALAGKDPTYWDKWLATYKTGKPVDRRKIKESAPSSSSGSEGAPEGAKKSLFS